MVAQTNGTGPTVRKPDDDPAVRAESMGTENVGKVPSSSLLRFILPNGAKVKDERRLWGRLSTYIIAPIFAWIYLFIAGAVNPMTNCVTGVTLLIGLLVEMLRLRGVIPIKYKNLFFSTLALQVFLIFVLTPKGMTHYRTKNSQIHKPRPVEDLLAELNAVKSQIQVKPIVDEIPALVVNLEADIEGEGPLPDPILDSIELPNAGHQSDRIEWADPFALQWYIGNKMERMQPKKIPPKVPLTTFSVVVISFDEHDYVKRTLDSIVEFTDPRILEEVILVDDHSLPPLSEDFNMADYPKGIIKYLRNDERVGLIQSRARGANSAIGDIVVFLDCHVKPRPHWETSILERINQNYRHVVVPAIPVLDGETWEQKGSAVGYKMMMEWDLAFHWFEDGTDDVPIMSGGLLAISTQWWHESGEYDLGMLQWGAENIEQSLRIWLCGGEISVARDSEVMHLFRKKFPYKLDGGVVGVNKERTVALWFDQYIPYYLKSKSYSVDTLLGKHDLSDRVQLKKELDCKDIRWWVERFREVLTSRNMIPARMFQLQLAKSTSDNIEIIIPETPVPPEAGPSEMTTTTNNGWCLIPVSALQHYFDVAMQDKESIPNFEDTEYGKLLGKLTNDYIKTTIDLQDARNIQTGLTVVPCSISNNALFWRHGGDDMDQLVFVGATTKDGFGNCITLGEASVGVNVVLNRCKYNMWKADHEKRIVTDQRLQFVDGDRIHDQNSNIESPDQLNNMVIMLNNPGKSISCMHATPGVMTDSFLNLSPAINDSCEDDRSHISWAEVNQVWDLHKRYEEFKKEYDEQTKKQSGLRGS